MTDVVTDIDKGWREIENETLKFSKSYVLVGFQKGSVTKRQVKGTRVKESNLSMPEIASQNEYGTNKIPARPFMSTSFDENYRTISRYINKQYSDVLDGSLSAKKALGLIGLLMIRLIKKKIRQIHFPPNSPKTIKEKGSSKPLIDFGQMIQSVREKVVMNNE